jgi:hypothetical protein
LSAAMVLEVVRGRRGEAEAGSLSCGREGGSKNAIGATFCRH